MNTDYLYLKTIDPDNTFGETVICGRPIISKEEPTSQSIRIALWDGLLWAKPTDRGYEFRVYCGGSFHDIGSGGSDDVWIGTVDEYNAALTAGTITEDTICIVKETPSITEYRLNNVYIDNLYIKDPITGEYIKVEP